MLELSCHCGQIRLRTDKRPEFIHECNCTLCRKSGARWAYFHPAEVELAGVPKSWCRQDKDDPSADVHFCPDCGSTTHFTLTAAAAAAAEFGNVVMGVNTRLADEVDLAGIELRFPDGQAWSGEGGFTYVREAVIIGEEADPAA